MTVTSRRQELIVGLMAVARAPWVAMEPPSRPDAPLPRIRLGDLRLPG